MKRDFPALQALRRDLKRDWQMYLFLILPVIYIIIFAYVPMAGLQIAFRKYSARLGIWGSKWVGMANFEKFVRSYYFGTTLKNTLRLSVYSIVFGFPLPILMALLLNCIKSERYRGVAQTITTLPHFISVVVLVGMIKMLFASNGIVNDVIQWMGGEPIYFLISPRWYRTLFIGSGIWQGLGWSSIIYLAALTNVDPQLMEAAVVDGANRFQRVWNVSLPALMPTISIQLIFSISGIMSASTEKTLLLYNEATYEVGDVIGTYVYREGILGGAFEYTTAIGLLMSIVSLVLITLANYGSRLFSENSLW